MTFHYLATFLAEAPDRPRGLAMWRRDDGGLDMLAWDWLELRWREAPDLVAPLLVGDDAGSAREVTREEAEEIAAELGIDPVPHEPPSIGEGSFDEESGTIAPLK